MGFGNIQSTPTKTNQNWVTQTFDERVAAADQGIALRNEGGDANVSYNIQASDSELLRDLALGVGDLVNNVLTSSQAVTSDALAKVSDVKTTGLTDGATSLQKTVLIGLAIGVAGLMALTIFRK